MKTIITTLLTPLRWLWKILTLTRRAFFDILFLFLIVLGLSVALMDREVVVQQNSMLVLSLAGNIVEETKPVDPISEVLSETLSDETPPQETLLQDILDIIDAAAQDSRITFLLLDLKDLGNVGLNQLNDIGRRLQQFRASGKKVVAAEDFYTQKSYFIASHADEIYLNPMGGVDLHGFGLFRLYFQEALEKLRVNYHVFRVGEFKSAVEPILRNSMSAEAKEQNRKWLSALWNDFSGDIVRQRNLKSDAIDNYINNITSELALAGGSTAQLAVTSGLVDGMKTRAELSSHLRDLAALRPGQRLNKISSANYLSTIDRSYEQHDHATDKIGLIIAQGPIVGGKQPPGVIGSESMRSVIRKARTRDDIKAVVLRINSGGGSAFASEIIRQELLELKKSKKPLIVSMGTMAASGGYWIAADADEIWASPTTLTGSIGIYGAIPTFENALARAGIRNDGIGTTPLAAGLDITQPLSPLLKETIQQSLEFGYQQFLSIVANGRKIDRKDIDKLAQGRVFDGQAAQNIGLVDKLGSLEDAIAAAADHAELTTYDAVYIHKDISARDRFLQKLTSQSTRFITSVTDSSDWLRVLKRLAVPYRDILLFDDPKGLYARCLIQFQ